MKPVKWSFSKKFELKKIKGICFDIDDTLSTEGMLTAEAFTALWELKKSGFWLVPVTGRPAGWCDHIARFWPVDAIVGENGAFAFFKKGQVFHRIKTPSGIKKTELEIKKKKLIAGLRENFLNIQWASDQPYREYDLAIDIAEDVLPWSLKSIHSLLAFCHKSGAQAKLSSIHINIWFGNYDKSKGFKFWLAHAAERFEKKPPFQDEWIYIGDSPNDEPMFKKFKFSIGVANLLPYLKDLKYPPQWITSKKSGLGFIEMAQRLKKSR